MEEKNISRSSIFRYKMKEVAKKREEKEGKSFPCKTNIEPNKKNIGREPGE